MATDLTPVTEEEALEYDMEALEAGVEKIKKNIEVFRQAIADEEAQISRYQEMIAIHKVHNRRK